MTATPPPVNVPPTNAAPIDDADRTTWPTVVGVVSIVFGVFGILGMCLGGVATVVMPRLFENMPDPNGQLKATSEAMERYLPVTLTIIVVMLAVAIVLLIGGILCTRRRMKARKVLITWAVLKMVFVVAAAVANVPIQRAQLEAQAASGGAPQAMGAQFGAAFGAIGGACNVIWGWILPVFILIWFSRRAVRDEVETWPHE